MCGIVGQIGPDACDRDTLLDMMGMLTHRGPDGAGLLVADGLAFGHLRLSIVDLANGQQPMSTADGRFWITFNGEIFNHVEIRSELEARGHVFRTRCDTEVVLNAFREWGEKCLERFNGQWAFAIWDRLTGRSFLSRDRFGVRPLFYSIVGGRTLVFASEIKAILADRRVSRELNRDALTDIFTSWTAMDGRTPLSSIHLLPQGSFMTIKGGGIEVHQWWGVDLSPDVIDRNRTAASWQEETRAALDEACRLRLRADVPVGTYLSGGLDSSIITWLSKTNHQPDIKTFSVAFADAAYDESDFQQLVADDLGTEHHRMAVDREVIARHFRRMVWHAETPIHRTAPVPLMELSGLVQQSGLKVVLTGEGADEVFGGYDQFKEDRIRRFWARNRRSPWRRRLLDRLQPNVPRSGQRARSFWYAFYEGTLDHTDGAAYSHYPRWRNGSTLLHLLNDAEAAGRPGSGSPLQAMRDWVERVESTAPAGFAEWDALSKAQYWEIRHFLAGYLLSSQGDRVSMANSVEGRYPFLDPDVFEVSRRMPPEYKLRVLQEKYVLKQAFQRDLPERIISRRKYPYRAPDSLALYRSGLREELTDRLSPDAVRSTGLFRPNAVEKLLKRLDHDEEPPARDNMALVLTYSTHLFHDMFINQEMTPTSVPNLDVSIDLTGTPNYVECLT